MQLGYQTVPLSFMKKETNKIKYFLYARKSSESEDRQIQSIESQVNRLKELANDYNLDIKKLYTESKTAKKPNNRPLFEEMIKRICLQIVGSILYIISVPTEASERKRKHIWAKLFNKSNNVKIPLYIWIELG